MSTFLLPTTSNRFASVCFGLCATLALPLFVSPIEAAAPSTYEEVLEASTKAAEGVNAWSTNMEVRANAGGMQTHAKGVMEGLGTRTRSTLSMDMMGQLIQMKMYKGDDGIHWTEMDSMGQLSIIKVNMREVEEMSAGDSSGSGGMSPGGSDDQHPAKLFPQTGNLFDYELKGTESLDNVDVYVLEGSVRTAFVGQPYPAGTTARIQVGVADGLTRKLEVLSAQGDLLMSVEYTKIDTKVELNAVDFEYIPPAGAQVTDMTDMVKQMKSGNPVQH